MDHLQTTADRILANATPTELSSLATYGYQEAADGLSSDELYTLRCLVQDGAKDLVAASE